MGPVEYAITALLISTPAAVASFLAMLWLPLRFFGISTRERLRDITLPEAVFFGLYALASGVLVGQLFGRSFL